MQAGLKELAGAFLSVLANPNVQVLCVWLGGCGWVGARLWVWVGVFMWVGVGGVVSV